MRKIIVVPDSFKGTLSSKEICEITKAEILSAFPDCSVVTIPVADGGEGSVDCFLAALGGETVSCTVKSPYFEDMTAKYGVINGDTAVIEIASCAGLPLAAEKKDPSSATTYGAGQLMLDAAKLGCKKIIMCLGGSCTNDGGTGAASAAGIRFQNHTGNFFIPTGKTLNEITGIDMSGFDRTLKGIEITTMCDIDNPLFGTNGAAHVFAPQKGADENMVTQLDSGLRHLSDIITSDLGADISNLPGGGAAGGMGAGMSAFFSSALKMGIDTVLDAVNFDSKLSGADLVITGEGKLDFQSLRGKVVSGVARRAKLENVPVIAVCGGYDCDMDEINNIGVSSVFSINTLPLQLHDSAPFSRKNLALTVRNIMGLLSIRT